jgi:2-methylcitrate dehydratase PrpD
MEYCEFILGDPVMRCPAEVWHAAKRSLLDLMAVAVAGRTTTASRIAHDTATTLWSAGSKPATLMFDGRTASPAGAAFAGAATIDSMDAHDGFKPAKGHAGVAILPALLAVSEAERTPMGGPEFLAALIIGYEVACRTAIAQHGSCPDYHASGSWNSLGAAAVTARLLKLDEAKLREALGISEYFGPRSQMMRVIDHPTMLKDSSSWGAMTGVTAAYLAQAGFTGAPAITVEAESQSELWSDLGSRWRITEQYFKLWPVCRWAQPAVEAALEIASASDFDHRSVRRIEIHTFHEARRLAGFQPRNTEEAQYAIAFPTACALVHRRCGFSEVTDAGLDDPDVRRLARGVEFCESEEFNAAFPAKRFAQLILHMDDGRTIKSRVTEPPGDPEQPLSDERLVEKFYEFTLPILGERRADALREAVGALEVPNVDVDALRCEVAKPIGA